ncbi:MAG: collagen binding domain-containing protein, partial [Faecousia sp.]
IGLILLYSNQMWDKSVSVATTKKDSNPNVPLRIATQFLIYEIVCGLRNPTTFESNSTNECGTSGDIFYNAGEASVPYFAPKYNALVDTIQAAKKIPSFTASSSGSAPTITLNGEETSVTDSNGVLSNFSFTDGSGAEFYKSGNTLYITQTRDISESTVFKATRNLPSASSSTYNVWYMSGSTYQTTVSLANASTGSLNAYFKLKAVPQVGNISLTKTTEDGQNLSGWRFGIYSNSACTNLVSGPYSTNSNGKISITDLTVGTYYVKELGHTDSAINAMYYCSSTNPQKVTVTANATTTVRFTNKLNTGSISLTKTTEDSKNLSGWQFGIYSDSACTTLVSEPHSTDASGKISVTGLTAGTYYVKELGHTDSTIYVLYYCSSTNPQPVTVTAGSTATVSFTNKLNTGGVKLVKETNTGKNLDGWKIGLYTDASCTNAVPGSPFTTGADGTVTVTGLTPGTYYAKEAVATDPYWACDTAVKTVTVTANGTATVTFTNTHKGRGKIIKAMPDGGSTACWEFEVYSSDSKLVGTFTTGEDGMVLTDYLLPGEYTVKEIIPEGSSYTCDAPNPKTITIEAGKTAEVTFTNRLKPGEILIQKVDIHGEPLAGAEFLLEWSEDGQQWQTVTYSDSLDVSAGTCTSDGLADGKLTSGEDGVVRFTGLSPGCIYRVTETKAPEGYQLLSEPVHEGSIQKDGEYFIQLTVVNAPVFQLPMTGSTGYSAMTAVQIGICVLLLIILFRLAKKRR